MDRLHATLPVVVKQYVWNVKYGLLGYPKFETPEPVVRYFEGLRDDDSVLDLGCGKGALLHSLREKGWTGPYCGVDISHSAIRSARNSGDHRTTWVVSGIEAFRSSLQWDHIAMVDSIYYVRLSELPAVLGRLKGMLTDRGTLLIYVHDALKFDAYLSQITRLCAAVRKIEPNLVSIKARLIAAAYVLTDMSSLLFEV